jgi:hypothetical protein
VVLPWLEESFDGLLGQSAVTSRLGDVAGATGAAVMVLEQTLAPATVDAELRLS